MIQEHCGGVTWCGSVTCGKQTKAGVLFQAGAILHSVSLFLLRSSLLLIVTSLHKL